MREQSQLDAYVANRLHPERLAPPEHAPLPVLLRWSRVFLAVGPVIELGGGRQHAAGDQRQGRPKLRRRAAPGCRPQCVPHRRVGRGVTSKALAIGVWISG